MLDPRTELPDSRVHTFGRTNESYAGGMNIGVEARKTAQNYEMYRNWNGGGVQFRPDNMEDESGVCSPPLWRNSPPRSPVHPQRPQNNYRYLSPSSRAQAIARGQWELMEMVKNMPESSYELSLKDLVEYHRVETRGECLVEEKSFGNEIGSQRGGAKRQESIKKIEKKAKMIRSGSNMDNRGLFLKMVFPMSLGGKKKKKTNPYANVSPKPDASSDKSFKVVEKEWWKKRSSLSDESESGGMSSNNGSTGSSGSSGSRGSSSSSSRSNSGRKKNGCLHGFSPFYSKKRKPAK